MKTKITKSELNAEPIKRLSLQREVVRNLSVRTSVRTGAGGCFGIVTDTEIASQSVVHPKNIQ